MDTNETLEELRAKIPGINTHPEHALECKGCGEQFSVTGSQDVVAAALCPKCGGGDIKLRYISYPTDGPGFQDDYDPDSIIFGGGKGCGATQLEPKIIE